MIKFLWRSTLEFVQSYDPNCRKMPLSHNVEEAFMKFPDRNLQAEDFQNVIGSSSSEDTDLVKLSVFM